MPISGRGARQKGSNAEKEVVKILTERGLPSMRVLGSGAMKGAVSDIKVGVKVKNGKMPEADESESILRAECKNQARAKDYHPSLDGDAAIVFTEAVKGQELNWDWYNQDECSKVVLIRRPKIPTGALAKKDYNQVWGCFVGLNDYIDLLKKAYPNRVFHFPDDEQPAPKAVKEVKPKAPAKPRAKRAAK